MHIGTQARSAASRSVVESVTTTKLVAGCDEYKTILKYLPNHYCTFLKLVLT